MMRMIGTMIALCALTACQKDETVANYGGAERQWTLLEIDGERFAARATLRFGDDGELRGEAPCNSYFGTQTAPYPWFRAENIGATRRACPDLAAEQRYLNLLAEMTLSEVAGDTLILSNDAGREMLFRAAQ